MCGDPDEALDVAALLAYQPLPAGDRVAVVTLGGGWGVLTADAPRRPRPRASPSCRGDVIAGIDELLPPFWSRGNPIDLVATVSDGVPRTHHRIVAAATTWTRHHAGADRQPEQRESGRRAATAGGFGLRRRSSAGVFAELNDRERALLGHIAAVAERAASPSSACPLVPVRRSVFPGLGRYAPVLLPSPPAAVGALAQRDLVRDCIRCGATRHYASGVTGRPRHPKSQRVSSPQMKTFWRILKLLGDYKWLTILGFALAFAQMGLGLVVPRIIQLTINNALIGGETGLLVTYGLALLGIAVVRFVVGVGRRLASGKASLGIEYDLRNRMWTHILRQSFSYFDRWPTGQLMSRAMSDVQNVRMFLGYGLIFFVTNIVMMVAIAVILLVMDWRLALMSLAFLPLLLLVTVRFSFRLKPILMDVQQKIADVTAAAEENVVGSRIVRIFAREDDELVKFSDRSYKVFEASVAAARTRAVYIPLIAFIPNLAVAFLLYYGGLQVIEGDLSLGSLVAFYSYLMMLVYPAQVIGWLTGLAQRAIASGERVYEVLDSPLEMAEKPDAQPLRDAFGMTAGGVRRRGERAGRGPHRLRHLRRRLVQLRRPTGAARREPRGPGRPHHRARRSHRLRQDDAHQPRAALLRYRRGARPRRRPGRARPAARRPASSHRHRQPGPVPVQHLHRREHPFRAPGGDGR